MVKKLYKKFLIILKKMESKPIYNILLMKHKKLKVQIFIPLYVLILVVEDKQ